MRPVGHMFLSLFLLMDGQRFLFLRFGLIKRFRQFLLEERGHVVDIV